MIRKLLLGLMIASVASLAWAGIPDAGQSEVWVGQQGTAFTDCGASFVPDGSGAPLEGAFRFQQGEGHECRIWVQVRNAEGNPIPLTQGDVWLEWGGTIVLCDDPYDGKDYATAMSQVTFPGLFFWQGTRAGGGAGSSHDVFVLGVELTAKAEIKINSPDMTGDEVAPGSPSYLKVDGADATRLFQKWGVNTDYTADFNYDGATDGADIVRFFQKWAVVCP